MDSILKFKNLQKYDKLLIHGITTKKVGNLALHTDDIKENVLENRQKLCDLLSIDFASYTGAEQTHSKNVQHITQADAGSGSLDYQTAIKNCDALITSSNVPFLNTNYADCCPIILFDPVTKTVATIHAGWKGTVLQIIKETIKAMHNTDPANIIAGIGPTIAKCCFEISGDIPQKLGAASTDSKAVLFQKNNQTFADLQTCNKQQLIACGVLPHNIEVMPLCTSCNNAQMFSYRADGSSTGRFSLFAKII